MAPKIGEGDYVNIRAGEGRTDDGDWGVVVKIIGDEFHVAIADGTTDRVFNRDEISKPRKVPTWFTAEKMRREWLAAKEKEAASAPVKDLVAGDVLPNGATVILFWRDDIDGDERPRGFVLAVQKNDPEPFGVWDVIHVEGIGWDTIGVHRFGSSRFDDAHDLFRARRSRLLRASVEKLTQRITKTDRE